MDRFEEKAKEILKDHEVPFNAAHWDQLNARLDQADKKSKKGIWFWMIGTGVAAALAIALLLSNGNDELNELANEVETPTQEEKQINDTEITQTETNQINRSLGDTLGTLFDNEVADASKSNNGIFQKESNTAIDPLENNDLDDALLAANSVTFEEQNKSLKYIIIEKLKWTFGNDLTNVLSHEFQQLEIEKLKITEPSVVPLDAGINLVVNASDYAAYAGVESGHNLILKSNANWIGVVDKKTQEFDRFTLSTPTNFMANYNFAFGNESKWSLGANYFNSQASRWSKNEFGANIGYRIDFDKDGWFRINTGLNVSHTSVDLAYLTWVDMIDPTYGYVQGSEETLSPTSDVLYQTWGGFGKFKNFFGSFDLSNLKLTYLNTPKYANAIELKLLAGYHFKLGDKFMLSPTLERVQSDQQAMYTPSLIANFNNQIIGGASLRNMNVATAMIGYVIKDRVRMNVGVGTYVRDEQLELKNKGYLEAGLAIKLIK